MKFEDFETGKTYQITTKAWETPDGDVVLGKVKVRTILPPVSPANIPIDVSPGEGRSWANFLRVYNDERKREHFIHPDTIESATVCDDVKPINARSV